MITNVLSRFMNHSVYFWLYA